MGYAQHSIKSGGQFEEKEYGKIFEYSTDVAEHCWDNKIGSDEDNKLAASCTHVIYVGNIKTGFVKSTRLAIVKKTVVYVLISDSDHTAMFQKWYIKNHIKYNE